MKLNLVIVCVYIYIYIYSQFRDYSRGEGFIILLENGKSVLRTIKKITFIGHI